MRKWKASIRVLLTVALLAGTSVGADAQFFDLLTRRSFWQGTWGFAGQTPIITVNGFSVTYQGVDGQPFPTSNIDIGRSAITFQAGAVSVVLTRRADDNIQMVATIGPNSSEPILLCKSTATHCP